MSHDDIRRAVMREAALGGRALACAGHGTPGGGLVITPHCPACDG